MEVVLGVIMMVMIMVTVIILIMIMLAGYVDELCM